MARPMAFEGWDLSSRLDWRGLGIGLGAALLVGGDLTVGGAHAATSTLAAIVAILAIAGAVRWPGFALGAIVVAVPLQLAALAYLYHLGTPAAVVRDLGFIKDGATGGICLAAIRASFAREGADQGHFDWLDRFSIAYVGIATGYLLIPILAPGSFGGEPWSVRLNAWRIDTLFVVLMIAARRLSFAAPTVKRIIIAVFVVAMILCGFGLYEEISNSGFNRFMVHTIQLPLYQLNVLHVAPPLGLDYVNRGPIGGSNILRVGSLFADPLSLGFYMVLPLAYGIERVRSTVSPIPVLGMLAGGLTVALANTRSAILAGAIVVVLSVWLAFRHRSRFRIRMVVVGLAGALVLAPFVVHSGVRHRFDQLFGSHQTTDEQGHVSSSTNGFHDLLHHPAGFGLGANPATGARSSTGNVTDTENSYLTVSSELGVAGMLCFIGMYLALLSKLSRARSLPGEVGRLASASWLAGCGLLVGGFFLPIWLDFAAALTFWGLAGVATARQPLPHAVASPGHESVEA